MVFIGLFGCGKLIFLCCINCMNDLVDSCCIDGEILFYGYNIYDKSVDVVVL